MSPARSAPSADLRDWIIGHLDPLEARVTESVTFVTVQERMRLGDVINVGRRGDQGMHQP